MGLRLTNFRRTGQPGLRTRYEGLYISNDIYRNTPLEEADVEVKSRGFHVTNDRIFCATDTKGGVYQKKSVGL